MAIGYTEKKDLQELIEVDKEEILDLLEQYPGAAILLALDQGCVDEVLERFKEIVKDYKEMKEIIKYILEMKRDGDVKISPALKENMEEASGKT